MATDQGRGQRQQQNTSSAKRHRQDNADRDTAGLQCRGTTHELVKRGRKAVALQGGSPDQESLQGEFEPAASEVEGARIRPRFSLIPYTQGAKAYTPPEPKWVTRGVYPQSTLLWID